MLTISKKIITYFSKICTPQFNNCRTRHLQADHGDAKTDPTRPRSNQSKANTSAIQDSVFEHLCAQMIKGHLSKTVSLINRAVEKFHSKKSIRRVPSIQRLMPFSSWRLIR